MGLRNPKNMTDAEIQAELAAITSHQQIKSPSEMSDDEIRAELASLEESALLPVVQEQHPDISGLQRFLKMNFAKDPEASFQSLKADNPNLVFQKVGDEIRIRRPEEKQWKVLDPNNFELADIGDMAYDIASGIGTSLATAGGALAGGPIGAAAAGAGSSALAETLRQGIGSLAGMNDNISGSQIALSGGIGAVSPFLFGAGTKTGELAAKGIKGADFLEKGLVGKGVDAVKDRFLPWFGQHISGIPAQVIKNAAKRLPGIKKLEKEGITDLAENTVQNISNAFQRHSDDIGEQIASAVNQGGDLIDVAHIREPLDELRAEILVEVEKTPTPYLKSRLSDIDGVISTFFGNPAREVRDEATGIIKIIPPDMPGGIDARTAYDLEKAIGELGTRFESQTNKIQAKMAGVPYADKQTKRVINEVSKRLNTAIEGAIPDGFKALKDDYRELSTLRREIGTKFKDPEKAMNILRNIGGKHREIFLAKLGKMDERLGTNLVEQAKLVQAYNFFGNPVTHAISTAGASPTARAGVGAVIGGMIGSRLSQDEDSSLRMLAPALGVWAGTKATSPAALRRAMEIGGGINAVGRFLNQKIPATQAAAKAAQFNYVRNRGE